MTVCSFTPSRVGIMTSVRVKPGTETGAWAWTRTARRVVSMAQDYSETSLTAAGEARECSTRLADFLCRVSLSTRELYRPADHAREQRRDAPQRTCIGQPERAVQGERAGANDCHTQRDYRQRQIVFISLTGVEEAVLCVNGRNRHEHHTDDERRRKGRDQSEREQEPPGQLGKPGEQRIAPPRNEPKLFQEAARAHQPVSAKPAKQFPSAVNRHGQPDDEAQDQETDRHTAPAFS